MTTQKAVALRLSNLLIKNNMNVYALCKKTAMSQSTIRTILNANYKSTRLDTIVNIANGFSMTLSEFFDDDLFKPDNLDVF